MNRVATGSAFDGVLSAVAAKLISTSVAFDLIVTASTMNHVATGTAFDDITTTTAADRVVASVTEQLISPTATINGVVAAAPVRSRAEQAAPDKPTFPC